MSDLPSAAQRQSAPAPSPAPPSPDAPLQGGCLCGAVRYEVSAPFYRRATATARTASGAPARAPRPTGACRETGFRLLSGEQRAARLPAARGRAQAVLWDLRIGALQRRSARRRGGRGAAGHARRRPRHPPAVPSVRRVRRRVGAAARRRAPPLPSARAAPQTPQASAAPGGVLEAACWCACGEALARGAMLAAIRPGTRARRRCAPRARAARTASAARRSARASPPAGSPGARGRRPRASTSTAPPPVARRARAARDRARPCR